MSMTNHEYGVPRREFLKSVTIGAAALLGSGKTEIAAARADQSGPLPRRVLGKTQAAVAILGLGCAYIAREDSTEAQTRQTIETALEGGITYFDTAQNYPNAEARLGPALAPVRDRVFLVTKLEHTDAQRAEQDLATSLRWLKTDHLDLLLMHGVGLPGWVDVPRILGKGGVMGYLRQAKAKGLTRFIGMSIHPPHGPAQKILEAVGAELDVVMPWINYLAQAEHDAEGQIIAKARSLQLGVVGMKTLGGDGQLADNYNRAFRYGLSVRGVHCVLVGARDPTQVSRALQAAREFRPLTEEEMRETISLGCKLQAAKSPKAALLRRHLGRDLGEG